MKRALLATSLLLVVSWSADRYFQTSAPTYLSTPNLRNHLIESGYHCISDRQNGDFSSGFLISREPATFMEANLLCKVGAMGPNWQGKVWVTLKTNFWHLASIPEQAAFRDWGGFFAFGDPALMEELDVVLK